jgi:ribosomal protein S18 acetylase RimI-like enzyme
MQHEYSIIRASVEQHQLLASLAERTFLESHGHSAPATDINSYIQGKYTPEVLAEELSDRSNIYHILYYRGAPAGFSKIILNSGHADIPETNVTKLERIYLLGEYYGKKLGHALFQHTLHLSQLEGQAGMWLYVWKQNKRAVDFYMKEGFQIIGTYDFRISENHSNPNHRMFLRYKS